MSPKFPSLRALTIVAISILPVCGALAAEGVYEIQIKDHVFSPAELEIPANTRVKLTVKNLDSTPAEFESKDFKAEKVIAGGKQASIMVGPLKPGTYGFHDEYHEATTKGKLIVK
jgi:plastocyanin